MTRRIVRWSVLAWVLCLGAVQGRTEEVPELAEFLVARSRVEKRVTAQGLLRNRTGAELTRIAVVLECLEAGTVVRSSEAFRRGALAKGRSCRVSVAIPKCPSFSSYRVRVKAKAGGADVEWIWAAAGLSEPPMLEGESRQPARVTLASHAMVAGETAGSLQVTCRVRNEGELPSRRAALRMRFFGADDVPVHEKTAILGDGVIAPGAETEFSIPLRAVPAHARAAVEIVQPQGPALSVPGGEFSDDARVEAAEFAFEKTGESQVLVAGQLRNGLDHLVRNVVVTLILEAEGGTELKRDDLLVPGPLYPGEVARFVSVVDDVVAFAAYRYEVAFEEEPEVKQRPPGEEEPPEDPALAGGDGSGEEPGGDPEPEPAGPVGKSVARKIGVFGLHVVQGEFVGQGKSMTYTGDLLMLKLRFLDEQGQSVKQPGKIEVIFSQGNKARGKASRPVPEGVWKLDFRALKPKQLGDQTVAFDPGTGLVYVGLLRWKEDTAFSWTLEVRFTSKEKERWTIRRLEEPYEAEPQGVDAK